MGVGVVWLGRVVVRWGGWLCTRERLRWGGGLRSAVVGGGGCAVRCGEARKGEVRGVCTPQWESATDRRVQYTGMTLACRSMVSGCVVLAEEFGRSRTGAEWSSHGDSTVQYTQTECGPERAFVRHASAIFSRD